MVSHNVFIYCYAVCGMLSLIASIAIIVMHYKSKRLKTPPWDLIVAQLAC